MARLKRDTELTSTLNRRGQIESRGTERRQIFERGHGSTAELTIHSSHQNPFPAHRRACDSVSFI